jgi:hypothetical protein
MHAKFKRETSFKNGHLKDLDIDRLVLEREDVEMQTGLNCVRVGSNCGFLST